MGQPQHTRNEAHFPFNTGYEEYVNARAAGANSYNIDGQTLTATAGQLPDLIYSGYPIPRFGRYSDYWSTIVTSGNVWGLADYSNRGFFTLENNVGNTTYPKPLPSESSYTLVRNADFPGINSSYLFGTVDDDVIGSTNGITMSTKSVFDGLGTVAAYTLSKRNYDDRAALLIPRAVAYSAGVLDYFFRGQMEISLPDSRVYAIVDHAAFAGAGVPPTNAQTGYKGFSKVRLKLKNTTDDVHAPGGGTYIQAMGAGTLVAVAKFHRNLSYQDNLSGEKGALTPEGLPVDPSRSPSEEIVVSQFITVSSVPSDPPQEFEFTFGQEIPINATDLYLQVVFRGALGQEADAVVVATRDISEPTYWAIMNATDYAITPDGHPYLCNATSQCYGGPMEGAFQFFLSDYTTTPGAIILLRNLPTAGFSRFAFLTDAQPDPQQLYNLSVVNIPPQPWTYQPSQNQWIFRTNGSTDRESTFVTRQRNVYNANLYPIVNAPDGRTALRGLAPDELSQPLLYPKPQPFHCISTQPTGCNEP